MASRDVVALALSSPIDWAQFEQLVASVLVADDLPRLRKIGGVADSGVDAIQESFFDGARETPTVVQVTSQRAQSLKVHDTLASLQSNSIPCKHLIVVFRHPVSSPVRTAIVDGGAAAGVAVDVRDQEYLIAQLSRPGSPIFARFFSTPHEQLSILLAQKDPLRLADTKLRHALMASLGAFVLQPRARLARTTLFEKVVIAGLVDTGGSTTLAELERRVSLLLPGEHLGRERMTAAVEALVKQGYCTRDGDRLVATETTITDLGQVASAAREAYSDLIAHILGQSEQITRIDDASKGYIERNVRRALVSLLRAVGPLPAPDAFDADDPELKGRLLPIAAADVPPEVGKTVLISLAAYVTDPRNRATIAAFLRSYAALAIWNLDPVGRSWQSTALSRSMISLDTDAVLALLVEELPEHRPVAKAIAALASEGVKLVISPHVLDEATVHVSRADVTFRRFRATLLRMPPSSVDSQVWHAVVRGYYYSYQAGNSQSPHTYWSKYYDRNDPRGYLEFLLSRRAPLTIEPLADVPLEWQPDLEALAAAALARRERSRLKAEFRDEDEMAERIRADVAMALHLSARARTAAAASARGYLASEDRAFELIQRHAAWGGRPHVHIPTRSLPQLTDFICPAVLTDDEFVALLFHPVIATAADQLKDDIERLTALGVDLKSVPLDRLEWELSRGLHSKVLDLASAAPELDAEPTEREVDATLAVLEGAHLAGYRMEPMVEELAARYRQAQSDADQERRRRIKSEEDMKALAIAARGITKRGRRRVNKMLRELGIDLDFPESDADPL